MRFSSLDGGERVNLVWSGINTAAGVRRITKGAAPEEDHFEYSNRVRR